MKTQTCTLIVAAVMCGSSAVAQQLPGTPEDNGLATNTATLYLNVPDAMNPDLRPNNNNPESIGVAIADNGNVLVGWEDDGDNLTDLEAVWDLCNSSGTSLNVATNITSSNPAFSGQSITSTFFSYFRADGTPIPAYTSWGPKIEANLFGAGIGMGASSFDLGKEVSAMAPYSDANEDDYPSVQLLHDGGTPVGILPGVTADYAAGDGAIRIGDWGYLSDGNIVIVSESRQQQDLVDKYGGTNAAIHVIYRIVDPSGNVVKPESLVSAVPEHSEMWGGVGVTTNGFGVRFSLNGRTTVRLFDNDGNPTTTNLDLGTLTGHEIAAQGGRGDSAGFHGNGKDAYVAVNAGSDSQGVPRVWVTVLNDDGTVRYSRSVADDETLINPSSADAAIEPSGKVIVVFNDLSSSTYSMVKGRMFEASGNPVGGTFYVGENEGPYTQFGPAQDPRVAWRNGLVAIAWTSQNCPTYPLMWTVALRTFSTFKPGSLESVGLTRIVPDTVVTNQGLDALGNWEPYTSVLGDSTFLIEANEFALTANGSVDPNNQRFVVALQPAAGGPMKLGEGFYADDGTPFRQQINLSRQNGNPGRVAGDKRPGAVNFMVAAETSAGQLPQFMSDQRWTSNYIYQADDRYVTVQSFSLDPTSLVQTPLHNAYDPIYGNDATMDPPGGGNQNSRTGGTVACLDNGNFVVVIDDKTMLTDTTNGEVTTAAIVTPDGKTVKNRFEVAPHDIWDNVAAFQGGFAVRVHNIIYFYDDSGTPMGTVDQATSGESYDSGRGDGTRIAAHINSPYVYLVGKVSTGNIIVVSVFDSRDQSFVTKATVSEPGFAGDFDRADLAIDALNRMCVAWDSQPPGYQNKQVAARVLAFDPSTKTITPLTESFLPFINVNPTNGITSSTMNVSMTTKQILIAAKGSINVNNEPNQGPTLNSTTGAPLKELNFYTVFSQPNPQTDPTPPVPGITVQINSITVSGNNVVMTWTGGKAPYAVQQKAALTDATWNDVQTTSNTTITVPMSGATGFFRISGSP